MDTRGGGQILELRGAAFRERNELLEAFDKHPFRASDTIIAAPDGPGKLLCFGSETQGCAAHDGAGFHAVTPPGKVISTSRIGDGTWLVADEGKIFRSDGKDFQAISTPKDIAFASVAGTSDRDVWGIHGGFTIFHHDGARWTEMGIPRSDSLVARAADDVAPGLPARSTPAPLARAFSSTPEGAWGARAPLAFAHLPPCSR